MGSCLGERRTGTPVIATAEKLRKAAKTATKRTARIYRELANTIMPASIEMEEDIGENHPTNKLPMLDIQVWMEEDSRIRYSFFSKPMATEELTWERSALPTKTKINILMEETGSRLRNCDPLTPWEEKEEIISRMNLQMMKGGHRERFRHMITTRAVYKHLDTLRKDREGKRPMYRNREEMKEEWKDRGGRPDSQDWFRRGGATGVLSVPNTPQEVLRERIERAVRAGQGPREQLLKIVEQPGVSVRNSLCRSNPIPREHCHRRACPLRDQGCKERCLKESVNYVARCKRCWEDLGEEGGKVYLGESSRSVYTRAMANPLKLPNKYSTQMAITQT